MGTSFLPFAGRPNLKKVWAKLIALRDSPLLNLSGLHAPFFLRVICGLQFGKYLGIAEVPGDRRILEILNGEFVSKLLTGKPLTIAALGEVRDALKSHYGNLDESGRGQQTFDTRVLVHVLAAIETAWLDALGKKEAVPVSVILAELVGTKARNFARVNGYLFINADVSATGLDYAPETGTTDWQAVRHLPTPDAESFVRLVRAAYEGYGFKYWKLKGGVLRPDLEADFVEAGFDAVGGEWTLDPNGAWSVDEAVTVIQRLQKTGCLKYIEDPVNGLENMAKTYAATGVPQASNMVGTDWPSLFEAIGRRAVQFPLADPHFWAGPQSGLEVIRAIMNAGGRAGVHSNNHGLFSLATVVHMMAASPEGVLAADTHYIYTRDDDPVVSTMGIRNGIVEIPADCVGLGVTVDWTKLMAAERAATALGAGARNDANQMRLLPGFSDWAFDPHSPSMVR